MCTTNTRVYSQYGAYIDLAAPGGDMQWYHDADGVYSTMPTYQVYLTTYYGYSKSYDYLKGTSQAAPHVAGLAALVWSLAPGLTPDQVQGLLQDTAADLGPAGWDPDYGWGRIDALAALLATQPPLPAPVLAPVDNADGDGAYTLAWNAVDGAASYRLEEIGAGGFQHRHAALQRRRAGLCGEQPGAGGVVLPPAGGERRPNERVERGAHGGCDPGGAGAGPDRQPGTGGCVHAGLERSVRGARLRIRGIRHADLHPTDHPLFGQRAVL